DVRPHIRGWGRRDGNQLPVRGRGGVCGHRFDGFAVGDDGSARLPELFAGLLQFGPDDLVDPAVGGEDAGDLVDPGGFGVQFLVDLQLVESVDLLEGHVDDVLRLDVIDGDRAGLAVRDVAELGDEFAFRVVVVIGGPDDLDDPVDHIGGGPLGEEQMESSEEDVTFVFEPPGDNLA